jgi:diguanylate cyclase (GGDEF)-like protein
MPKSKIRLVRTVRGAAAKAPAPRRTAVSKTSSSSKKASRSEAARLAAEVERLQAELAAARAQVAQLEARADFDALLEIMNRRGFERELRRALAYVRRYGTTATLIYLDLDNFKPVNDLHGHPAGDRVLKAVASTLLRTVRESDVVSRLGGDEFGILLWNIGKAQAAAKAMELEGAIAATKIRLGSAAVSVGASAGFAMFQAGDAPADVIARADAAMYARKRAGQPQGKIKIKSIGRRTS